MKIKNKKRPSTVLLLLLLSVCFMCGCGSAPDILLQNGEAVSAQADKAENGDGEGADDESAESAETESIGQICVYVCGEVLSPGVYKLPEGSRIYEAVELAGGMSGEADLQSVNLAQPVSDGDMIRIPSLSEEIEPGAVVTSGSYEAAGSSSSVSSGSSSGSSASGTAEEGKVNINTATGEELMSLNGIGEAKAAAIIQYREEYGAFSRIDDIKNVSGIGDGIFEKIKDSITV